MTYGVHFNRFSQDFIKIQYK